MNDIKDLMQNEDFIKSCDAIFGYLRLINNKLLNKSNVTYNASFEEAIDFSISSNGLSVIKSFFYNTLHSHTTVLLCRNMIEDFALKEMYIKGQVPKESRELIKLNGYIEDYKQYKNLDGEEFKKIISYDELKKNYLDSIGVYAKFGIKENDIKKMDIPFLMDKKMTYSKLIEKYLPELIDYYKLLSFYIHPHDYSTENMDEYVDAFFVKIIIKLMEYYYDKIDKKIKWSFTKESKMFLMYGVDSPYNYGLMFLNNCFEEKKIIRDLRLKVEKRLGEKNYLVYLLKVLPDMVYDIGTDSIHGQTENIKMKFKTIIEIFSLYDWLYFKENYSEDFFYLVNYYSVIKIGEICDLNCEEYYKKAFDIYSKIYPEADNYKKFKEVFGQTLGFTIDGNYNRLTLNKLINRYADNCFKEIKVDGAGSLSVFMKILYTESCSLGHGKCYSFFANTGSFMDEFNVISLFDNMINFFLVKFNLYLKIFDVDKEYLKLVHQVDKVIKSINEINKKKREFLALKIKVSNFEDLIVK